MNLATVSYTDFVGAINQTNVLPGSFVTLNRWAVHSFMSTASFVVELGCTTGFSLREISRLTGCRGIGVDINERSVRAAQANAAEQNATERLTFRVADGDTFTPPEAPTHVIVGAALGFFPDPARTVQHITSYLRDGGRLLASPYFITKELPPSLVKEAQAVLGITPTIQPYKEVMKVYKGLRISYEDRLKPELETEDEMRHYCESTTARYIARSGGDAGQYEVVYSRLYKIKELCNRLHDHHAYSVLVLEYVRSEFPHRYVELF